MEALTAWWAQLDFSLIIMNCIKIAVTVIICFVSIKIGRHVIKGAFAKMQSTKNGKRAETLSTVFCSIWRYFVYFITVMVVLSILGINIVPVLASAGVVGIAIGFGAQSLVKDIITGFFILFENYYEVGDYVMAGGVQGFVQEIGLRSTKIKDWNGELHIYPNGQVTVVTNYSRGDIKTVVQIPISCEVDLSLALQVIERACQAAKQECSHFSKGPIVHGLERVEQATMLIRISFWSSLEDQFDLEMLVRNRCKEALDNLGMAIPYSYSKLVMEQAEVSKARGSEYG